MKNGHLQQTVLSSDPNYWWKLNTPKQKKIFIGIALLIITCLLLLLFYPAFTVKMQICNSPTCVRIAAELNRRIDSSVDPCEDFYRFTCLHALDVIQTDDLDSLTLTAIEDDMQTQIRQLLEEPAVNEDTLPLRITKKFYSACLDESAIQSQGLRGIKDIFRQIGGWPTLEGDDWDEEAFDWVRSIGILAKMGVNFDVFFKVTVDRDKSDGKRYVLGLHDVEYTPTEISNDLKNLYLNYMQDISVSFGANRFRAKEDSTEILDMFLDLAKMTKASIESNQTNLFDKLTVSELTYQHPTIPWFDYIRSLLNPYDIMLTYYHEVIVADPVYIKKLESFLRDTPKRNIANFIAWHTIQYLINYLPVQVLDKAHEFLQKINMGTEKTPRWRTCLKATEERMNSVIAATLMQKFNNDGIRHKIIDMVNRLKYQFRLNLLSLDWFDRETKELILEKLITSVEEIISDSDLLSMKNRNQLLFEQVELRNKTFLDFVLDLDRVRMNEEFSKLKKTYDDNLLRDDRFILGTRIHYSKKKNSLALPLGILRGMFYNAARPDYVNYGVLGSLIAHEISHIFMDAHDVYRRGDLRNNWTPTTLVRYDEKLKCLESQQQQNLHNLTEANFQLTKDEDIADLAGYKIAYETYVNMVRVSGAEPLLPGMKYSPNQLFWISSAIRHCPGSSTESVDIAETSYRRPSSTKLRVNVPLQNLKEFAFDFACPLGSRMNPRKKCQIW